MNREMKFRVWDKEDKKYVSPSHIAINGNGILLITNSGMYLDFKNEHYAHLSQKYIVQQWTGCYDKNRTPIYEGDILANDLILPHDNDNIGVVYFAAGTFMIDGDGPFFDHVYGHSPDILDNHTVIGNKFENPELLKA
jgi:uncharacterized phage protein (TIGR01671 family)